MLEDERRIEKKEKGTPVSHPVVKPLEPPSMTVVATLNGREVYGAKMKTMNEEVTLPYKWEGALSNGRTFGPYLVTYSDGKTVFYGSFKVGVDWSGHREISVKLEPCWPSDITPPGKGRGGIEWF